MGYELLSKGGIKAIAVEQIAIECECGGMFADSESGSYSIRFGHTNGVRCDDCDTYMAISLVRRMIHKGKVTTS
jgi:hypothetical protein